MLPINAAQPSAISRSTKIKDTGKGTSPEVAAAGPMVNSKQPALRACHALPDDLAFYVGKDLSVTPKEKEFLAAGDVLSFWTSRVGKDPVARVGMSIWANRDQLAAAIDQTGAEHWKPEIGLLAAIGLLFKGYPHGLSAPTQKEELVDYWSWMGDVTRQRVLQKGADEGLFDDDPLLVLCNGGSGIIDPEKGKILLEQVGLGLATAHAAELQDDRKNTEGAIPGLLSLDQIAQYHHKVFKSLGLPKNTYGGTPIMLGPVTHQFQLMVAGGLYAPDGDPTD